MHRAGNECSGGSLIEISGSIWLQIIIHRNDIFAVNYDYVYFYLQLYSTQ
jgi:hypothetical protein